VDRKAILLGGAVAAGVALLLFRAGSEETTTARGPSPAPKPRAKSDAGKASGAWYPGYLTGDAEQTDDMTALARMLASEDPDPGVQVVIGWITIQRARRLGWDLYRFITRGQGYGPGPQSRPGVHASTARPPTVATRRLASELLSGAAQPSAVIREVKPGSWMERGQGPADDSLVQLQTKWKEGAWARLSSGEKLTKWVLYSANKPILTPHDGQTAAALLDTLPIVEAQEPSRDRPLVA
jgi:hypothetical protein